MNQKDQLKELYDEYTQDERFKHLRREGIYFVPGAGPLNPVLMIIGEAPGEMENAFREPFRGRAGNNLSHFLMDIGLQPYNVFRTNVIKYWPLDTEYPEDKKTRTPTEEEILTSRDYLKTEIDIVQPQFIGLCGRSALQAIYPNKKQIFRDHGQLLDSKYVPLYHPALIEYDSTKKPLVKSGYAMLKGHMQNAGQLHTA